MKPPPPTGRYRARPAGSLPAGRWAAGALRVGEGHQFPMNQIPVAARAAEARLAVLLLPAGIGQRIGGTPSQDQVLRHLERRELGVEMVKPAPDHVRFDAAGLGAEALMVPVSPFHGAIDEESEDDLGGSGADSQGNWRLRIMVHRKTERNPLFSGRWFEDDIILLYLRWYFRFKLSYRDLVAISGKSGPRPPRRGGSYESETTDLYGLWGLRTMFRKPGCLHREHR